MQILSLSIELSFCVAVLSPLFIEWSLILLSLPALICKSRSYSSSLFVTNYWKLIEAHAAQPARETDEFWKFNSVIDCLQWLLMPYPLHNCHPWSDVDETLMHATASRSSLRRPGFALTLFQLLDALTINVWSRTLH